MGACAAAGSQAMASAKGITSLLAIDRGGSVRMVRVLSFFSPYCSCSPLRNTDWFVKKRGSRTIAQSAKRGGCLRRLVLGGVLLLAGLYLTWGVCLFALRFVDPFTSGIQIQRRVESVFRHGSYRKRYSFVPLTRISLELQHAVIAAEDGRFYQHHGIDWKAVEKVMDESREAGTVTRGASTITQQLVKNLFFTTHRNPVRKAFEYTLAPLADRIPRETAGSRAVSQHRGMGTRRLRRGGGRAVSLRDNRRAAGS